MEKLLFAGSFDPITIAHEDIIERASKMSDKLIVGVAHNSEKDYHFTLNKRLKLLEKALENYDNVEVKVIEGLVVDFAKVHDIKYQLRAIRNANDLLYEQDLYYNNLHIDKDIETIVLLSNQSLTHVSSSRVRELIFFEKSFSHLVSDEVYQLILQK